MSMSVAIKPTNISIIMAIIGLIISLTIIGVGIYLIVLIIKSLRIYIRKNS